MTDRNVQFVGTIPAAYDRFLGPLLFDPYARDLASRVAAAPGTAVLEIAAGTGILTERLRRALPAPCALTATDLNEPMLAFARSKLADLEVEWRVADAQELPFSEATFDAVACQFGIMFVPDKGRAFREARRVLRGGGILAFNTWGPQAENPAVRVANQIVRRFFASDPPNFYDVPFSFHDEALIRELLRAAHFDVVRLDRVAWEARSPSALDAARGLVTGNPIVLAVNERASAPLEEVVRAVAAGLAAEGGEAPLRLPTSALVVIARAV
jgi:ubiquinone/menaquinone biosynthesis C-methylase UbiE